MAIANNPERRSKDEGDIVDVLKLSRDGLIPENFSILDKDRIYLFAERFGLREMDESLFDMISGDPDTPGDYEL